MTTGIKWQQEITINLKDKRKNLGIKKTATSAMKKRLMTTHKLLSLSDVSIYIHVFKIIHYLTLLLKKDQQ